MILSDCDIQKLIEKKKLVIEPFDEKSLQPSSYDLRLAETIRVFDGHNVSEIDLKRKNVITQEVKLLESGYVVHPGEFLLGATLEYFEIPNNLAAILDGKTSLGRLGLITHANAGFVDPGFKGQLTFDISNISRLPIRIYPLMKIAQIYFLQTSSPVKIPYGDKRLGSKYFGQKGPGESKYFKNFKEKKK